MPVRLSYAVISEGRLSLAKMICGYALKLTFNERSATERSIQVLVGAEIGCSKHYLKGQKKPVPSESLGSRERIFESLSIAGPGH